MSDGDAFLRLFLAAVHRWGTAGAVACDVAAGGRLYGMGIADVAPWRRPLVRLVQLAIWAEVNTRWGNYRARRRLSMWITWSQEYRETRAAMHTLCAVKDESRERDSL